METRRKIKLLVSLLLIALLFSAVAFPSYAWMRENVRTARIRHNSRMSPIIFIPGSSATQDRFDDLISELNSAQKNHSQLKITVQEDGTMKTTGKIQQSDSQPFIVVGFENNKDGYDNIKKQAVWFNKAMDYLVNKYHFNHFSGIGHSNGGLIYTLYLEKYFDSDSLTINSLMTIASPFNFSEKNINKRTQMLADLIDDKAALPKNLTMYSIAGTEDYSDDGTVPFQSVEAGKYIYQNQVKHYTEITVTGVDSSHSDLPQNQQIVQLIEQYILKDPNNNRNPRNNPSS